MASCRITCRCASGSSSRSTAPRSRVEKGQQHQHLLEIRFPRLRCPESDGPRCRIHYRVFGDEYMHRWRPVAAACIAEKLLDGFLQSVSHANLDRDFASTRRLRRTSPGRPSPRRCSTMGGWNTGSSDAQARSLEVRTLHHEDQASAGSSAGTHRPSWVVRRSARCCQRDELHPHGPARTELQFNFHQSPVIAVRPEQVEASQRVPLRKPAGRSVLGCTHGAD